ncbi:hypothetical protein BDV95DRAFT_558016 [Massariosphaeria phaeospora]|uniref:Uncharacterized protein n=1 Tax=Massariosphaeria phaeospora TaxID=100035 RepID=A0A7C8IHS5_9PLEO|nr:hypothetical protein BDV95DRAFT_558016 [Massariosphaeria phaeospora]
MSYLRYKHTHERDSPYVEDEQFYSRPLVRRNSKRQRIDLYDDDEYDDYPYLSSAKPSKPSRALTIRQPSQLEKYNVWSYAPSNNERRCDSDEEERHTQRYRHTQKHYASRPSASDEDDDDDNEREFQLKIKAKFGRPKSSHSHKAFAWPGELFKRREIWEGEDWESRERQHRGSFWDDEPELKERIFRYRKVKRTRTDEWKPLSGFRRS